MKLNMPILSRGSVIVLLAIGASMSMPQRAAAADTSPRRVIDLNGTWQVAEGAMDSMPKQFEHTVPVPGLVDMAQPAFAEVGKKSDKRQAFWYRRTFTRRRPGAGRRHAEDPQGPVRHEGLAQRPSWSASICRASRRRCWT